MLEAANTIGMLVLDVDTLTDADTLTVDRLVGPASGRNCVLLLAEGLRLVRIETLALLLANSDRVIMVLTLALLVERALGEEEVVDVSVRLLNLLADTLYVSDPLPLPLALIDEEAEVVVERVTLPLTDEEPDVVGERVPLTLGEVETELVDERVSLAEGDEVPEEVSLGVGVVLLD